MISSEYAAGFFDGEGSVVIRYNSARQYHYIKIVVSNTVRSILEEFQHRWGGSINGRVDKRRPRCRICYNWELQNKACESFLHDVLPFSKVKPKQIALGLEFLTTYRLPNEAPRRLTDVEKEMRSSIAEQVHDLNRVPTYAPDPNEIKRAPGRPRLMKAS